MFCSASRYSFSNSSIDTSFTSHTLLLFTIYPSPSVILFWDVPVSSSLLSSVLSNSILGRLVLSLVSCPVYFSFVVVFYPLNFLFVSILHCALSLLLFCLVCTIFFIVFLIGCDTPPRSVILSSIAL